MRVSTLTTPTMGRRTLRIVGLSCLFAPFQQANSITEQGAAIKARTGGAVVRANSLGVAAVADKVVVVRHGTNFRVVTQDQDAVL